MPRAASLQSFVDALLESFRTPNVGRLVRGVADKIFKAAELAAAAGSPSPVHLPVCRHLFPALKSASGHGGPSARLAQTLSIIEPDLHWYRRPPTGHEQDGFRDNHANAVVIGEGGLEVRSDICIGVSLLAPATRYPDHRHPPEEIYSVLSPGEWWQERAVWHEPGIGGVVHNPPDVVHAMRATTAPLLAVWCLWTGQRHE